MIDVIITSDIRIYCEGLGKILSSTRGVNVVGIAESCKSAIEKISAEPADIVLLDMTMVGGCELAKHIPQASPKTKIVALAVSYDESNIVRCAEAGVTCYVPREASVDELIEAIMEAARGECYCPPKIAACLLKKVRHQSSTNRTRNLSAPGNEFGARTAALDDRHSRLTRREREIARFLAKGMSNKQIARTLSIEVSTVKNHVHNMLVKLEVQNRSQAVVIMQKTCAPDFLVPSI